MTTLYDDVIAIATMQKPFDAQYPYTVNDIEATNLMGRDVAFLVKNEPSRNEAHFYDGFIMFLGKKIDISLGRVNNGDYVIVSITFESNLSEYVNPLPFDNVEVIE